MNTQKYLIYKIGKNKVRHLIKGFLTKDKLEYYDNLNNKYNNVMVEGFCRSCKRYKYIKLSDWLINPYLICSYCGSLKTNCYWLQKENNSMGRLSIITFPPKIIYRQFQDKYTNIISCENQIDENNIEYYPTNIIGTNETAWITETISDEHFIIWDGGDINKYKLISFYMLPYLYNYPAHQGCPTDYDLYGSNNNKWELLISVKNDDPNGGIIHNIKIEKQNYYSKFKISNFFGKKVQIMPTFETARYDVLNINKYIDYGDGNPNDYFSKNNTTWLVNYDDLSLTEITIELKKLAVLKKLKLYNIIPNNDYFNNIILSLPNKLDILGSNDNINYEPILTLYNTDTKNIIDREIVSYKEYKYIRFNNFNFNLKKYEPRVIDVENIIPLNNEDYIDKFYLTIPDIITYKKNNDDEYIHYNLNDFDKIEKIENLNNIIFESNNSNDLTYFIEFDSERSLSKIILNYNNKSSIFINKNKNYNISNIEILGSNDNLNYENIIINKNNNIFTLNKNYYKYYNINIFGSIQEKIINLNDIEIIIAQNGDGCDINDVFNNYDNIIWYPNIIEQFNPISNKSNCSIRLYLKNETILSGIIINSINNNNFNYNIYGSNDKLKWNKINNTKLDNVNNYNILKNPNNLINNNVGYKYYMIWDFIRNDSNLENKLEITNIFLFTNKNEYGPVSIKLPEIYENNKMMENIPRYMGINNIELLTAIFPYDENSIVSGELKETYGSLSIGSLILTEEYKQKVKPLITIDPETTDDSYYRSIFHSHYHGN